MLIKDMQCIIDSLAKQEEIFNIHMNKYLKYM